MFPFRSHRKFMRWMIWQWFSWGQIWYVHLHVQRISFKVTYSMHHYDVTHSLFVVLFTAAYFSAWLLVQLLYRIRFEYISNACCGQTKHDTDNTLFACMVYTGWQKKPLGLEKSWFGHCLVFSRFFLGKRPPYRSSHKSLKSKISIAQITFLSPKIMFEGQNSDRFSEAMTQNWHQIRSLSKNVHKSPLITSTSIVSSTVLEIITLCEHFGVGIPAV